jgi:hypothetical protein
LTSATAESILRAHVGCELVVSAAQVLREDVQRNSAVGCAGICTSSTRPVNQTPAPLDRHSAYDEIDQHIAGRGGLVARSHSRSPLP